MQKETILGSLFSKTIYKSTIDNYDSINQKLVADIESYVKEKPGSVAATTDVMGNTNNANLEDAVDNLHRRSKYKDLFVELSKHVSDFFIAKGYDLEKFDAHFTKAWATYTTKGQYIASHKHTASHFSCVYYVRNDNMGNIKFEQELAAQTGMYIPPTEQYISNWNEFNFASYNIPVQSGDFVIFPSELLHYTETNERDIPRISISADILLTMKNGVSTEHCLPHPKSWAVIDVK